MSESKTCPRCGATLPADAPAGSCPRCLLAEGLESGEGGADGRPAAPTPAEMAPHFPQLEILEVLGQGGMGVVYRARQKALDRLVALKVLSPEAAREAGFAERFSREARTLARLQHPNIVGVHDFGTSDGLYYLVMEYVDGPNLRRVIADGKLSPREALGIVPQVCDALQYAHDHGVVHRDIKPENILLDRSGRVRIADFGLAKILQRTPVDMTITRAGQVMGTLHYMAPEQYRAPDAVDHRADIYSLGVVFYEMLTGELPVGAFPRPSERTGVDARLDGVVLRALEREKERRWQHASEVKERVSAIAAGPEASPAPAPAAGAGAATATPAVPPPPPPPEPRLSRLAVAGGLGVPAALLAGYLGWGVVRLLGGEDAAHAAARTGFVFCVATGLAGWIGAIAGWVAIHRSRGALVGLPWAVAGTLLAPALFCCGVPAVYFGATVPDDLPVRIEEAGGARSVHLPGLTVEHTPEGTRVKMPGLDVTNRNNAPLPGGPGADLAPEIENAAPSLPPEARLALLRDLDRAWGELLPHLGFEGEEARARLLAAPDRTRLEGMTLEERYREKLQFRLGAAGLEYADFESSKPEEMRLVRVILDGTGLLGRAVRTDGNLVLSCPVAMERGRWRFTLGPVERVRVCGGPASATPKWRADAVRGLERLWAGQGPALLRERFPGTDLADRASFFRMYALALRASGLSGRMVWSDGAATISLPCRWADGEWEVPGSPVQRLDRAPLPEDRDGWLGEDPAPAEEPAAAPAKPQGK